MNLDSFCELEKSRNDRLQIKRNQLKKLLSESTECDSALGKFKINSKNMSIIENLLGENYQKEKVELTTHNAVYYTATKRKSTKFMTINGLCKKCNRCKLFIQKLETTESADSEVLPSQSDSSDQIEVENGKLMQELEQYDTLQPAQQIQLVEQLKAFKNYRHYNFSMSEQPELDNTVIRKSLIKFKNTNLFLNFN